MKILSKIEKKLTSFYNSVVCKLEKTSQKDLLKGNKPLSWWRKIKLFFIMRELSDNEKEIAKRLIKWENAIKYQPINFQQITIAHLINDLAKKYNSSFNIDFENSMIVLGSCDEKSNSENARLIANNLFRREFVSLIYFINYLKEEGVIYLVPTDDYAIDYNELREQKYTLKGYTAHESTINDEEFILLLKDLFYKCIVPTEYLIKYCNKNFFKTDEEVRFETSMTKSETAIKYTRLSMFFAIGIGLVSIATSIVTCRSPNQNLINIDNKLTTVIEKMDSSTIILKENLVKLNSKNKKKKQ